MPATSPLRQRRRRVHANGGDRPVGTKSAEPSKRSTMMPDTDTGEHRLCWAIPEITDGDLLRSSRRQRGAHAGWVVTVAELTCSGTRQVAAPPAA